MDRGDRQRQQAVDNLFANKARVVERARSEQRERGGHRHPWSAAFTGGVRNRLPLEEAAPGASCLLLRVAKQSHATALPSFKDPTAMLASADRPRSAMGASFGDDAVSRMERARAIAEARAREATVERYESTYAKRRVADGSVRVANPQHQEMSRRLPAATEIAAIIGGAYYEPPAVKKPRAAPNMIELNKRHVRSASAVVAACRAKGYI